MRQELESAAESHPGYVPYKSIILFTFRADDDGADGIAARVLVMRDTGTSDELVEDRYTLQNRALNGSMVVQDETITRKNYTTAELKARIKAGFGYEHLVHANLSYVSSDTCRDEEFPSTLYRISFCSKSDEQVLNSSCLG